MKRHLIWCSLFLTALVAISCNTSAQSPILLLRHVTVIDATGTPPRKDVDILIRGSRIEKIARRIPAAPGTAMIQASGKFLVPGLWDMHVHVWDADLAFPLFLANGVTGVRNMGGHPEDLKRWREELESGRRLGPRLIACGPVVDGSPPVHPDHSVVVSNAADAASAVDHLQLQGWDFIKVYDNVPRDAYFALAREAKKDGIPFVGHVPLAVTAMEASDAGQESIEHFEGLGYVISPVGDQFRLDRLGRIGKPSQPGEMMKIPFRIANELKTLSDTYDASRAADLFAHLRRNDTWQVPTLSVSYVYASTGNRAVYEDERLKYVARQERDSWEHNPIVHIAIPEYIRGRKLWLQEALRITREAHQAGVSFLAGSDSGGVPYLYYGSSLHDELALLVEAGFTPIEALQAATRAPAQFLGLKDSGTIAVGNRADLVLLTDDPLANIHNISKIEAVIRDGKLYDRKTLDEFLSTTEKRAK